MLLWDCFPLYYAYDIFYGQGKDVTEVGKEILLLMLGGFVGSFKVIDFWFNNQENDNIIRTSKMTKHLKESKMGCWEHWYHNKTIKLFVTLSYLMYLPICK